MHTGRDKHTQMLPKNNRRHMQLDKHFILATFRSCYQNNATGFELPQFFQLKIFNASERKFFKAITFSSHRKEERRLFIEPFWSCFPKKNNPSSKLGPDTFIRRINNVIL